PSDHGEGAVLLHDGYRQSRLLLRGLRDRRSRLLRGDDQGPRQVQGSDPHQTVAGSRRPHAVTQGGAGRRKGAARQLPDRREDLARPLGTVTRRLRALKIGLLIMAGLSLLAVIPAGRLPNYLPGELPGDGAQAREPRTR